MSTTGYLYSRYRGKFEVHYGNIFPMNYDRRRNEYVKFSYSNGRFDKHTTCWAKPGVMHYGALWLPERDDELARKLFLEYEKDCVKELEERIARHRSTIEVLKDQVIYDGQLSNV